MNIEELRAFCLSLPGTTEDIKWGEHLCFCVGNKIYLMAGLDQSPVTASFKVLTSNFDEFASRDGFGQAPYMAKKQWVFTSDINNLTTKEWREVITNSYNLIKSKLSKRAQQEL